MGSRANRIYGTGSTRVVIDEGESCNIVLTIADVAGSTVSSFTTLLFTLFNEATEAVINSRTNVSCNNANNCTYTAGVLTIRLEAADNDVVSTTAEYGDEEWHVIRVSGTYSDGVATRTIIEERRFPVRKLT